MPDRPLRRHRPALRSERPLDLLVPEMSEITITPTLQTQRLILRPLALSDAPAIQRHFNNWNIIQHLASVVPWPYPEDGAETFIARELEKVAAGEEIYNWMLVLRGGDGEAIGNIRFRPRSDDPKGNRGFWLAERYWNQGLMSEAVSAVNDFAFRTLGIEGLLRLQCGDQRGVTPGQAKDRRRTCRLHRACPSQRSDARGKMARDAGKLAAAKFIAKRSNPAGADGRIASRVRLAHLPCAKRDIRRERGFSGRVRCRRRKTGAQPISE